MKNRGIAFAFLTAIISGFSVFANGLFVTKTDPTVFAFVRNGFVFMLLSGWLMKGGAARLFSSLTRRDWIRLVLIGIIGGGLPFAMFFSGLAMIGPVNGNILHKSLFLWVALLAVPLLRERVSAIQGIGYAAIFSALFLIGNTASVSLNTGSLLVLGATILWAIEHIIAKRTLADISPAVVAWGRMAFGLPILGILVAVMGKTGMVFSYDSGMIAPVVVSAIFLSAYMISWYTALRSAPATVVSSVLVIAPVITTLVSAGIGTKGYPHARIVSDVLLVAGAALVSILSVRKPQHQPVNEIA